MADTKISAESLIDALASGDRYLVVDDPLGTPANKGATVEQMRAFIAVNLPSNLSLAVSASGNALTIALKGQDGNDASAANPLYAAFRSATAGTGTPDWSTLAAGLSLVISSGSTLGTAGNIPFRLWVVLFNDGGTLRLGVVNCRVGGATPTQIVALADDAIASSTAEGGAGGADTAGIFYTGSAVASKAYRIIGYVECGSTSFTAGTWGTSGTGLIDKVQLFGPGVSKPGDVVETKIGTSTGSTTVDNTTPVQTGLSCAIAPKSAANLVEVDVRGAVSTGQNSGYIQANISRGTGPTNIGSSQVAANQVAGYVDSSATLYALDAPGTTSSTTYYIYIVASGALGVAAQWNRLTATTIMVLKERMG